MVDVVLVTGRRMPIPDPESHLLVDALQDLGLSASVQPWGDEFEWREAPLVVVRTPWDYFDARERFLEWACDVAAATSLVNPVEVLEWNSHKGYLRELRARGVPAIETTVVPHGAPADVQDAAMRAHNGEVVVKPAVGGGAVGALRAHATDAAARDHLAALADSGDALVLPEDPGIDLRAHFRIDHVNRDGDVIDIVFGDRVDVIGQRQTVGRQAQLNVGRRLRD